MKLPSRLGYLIACLALLTPPPVAARPVLSTGDEVPGFGAIGTGGFTLKGIGADGRALVHATLSDGTQGLYWAADRQLSSIWTTRDAPGVQVEMWGARVAANGAGVFPAFAPGAQSHFYYVVSEGGNVRTVIPPTQDAGGNSICLFDFDNVWITSAGQLAVDAFLVPAGADCHSAPRDVEEAIFISDGARWSLLLHSSNLPGFARSLRIAGVSESGEVIASFVSHTGPGDGMRIVAADRTRVRSIAAAGDPAPGGSAIESINGIAVAPGGDLAFTAYAGGVEHVYLIRSGEWHDLGANNGGRILGVSDTGRVLMLISDRQVVALEATGSREVLFDVEDDLSDTYYSALIGDAEINAAGAVAFSTWSIDGTAGHALWTTSPDGPLLSLASGDPARDGAVVATGGFSGAGSVCFGEGGQLGLVVPGASGHEGLICIDSEGAHLIAQSGDSAPNGDYFRGFGQCAFSDDGALTFTAQRAVPWGRSQTHYVQYSIYRASDAAIEKLVADFDPIANGEELADSGSPMSFVSNRQGKVLLRDGDGILLYEHGLLVPFLLGEDIREGAIADDGTTVLIGRTRAWSPDQYDGYDGVLLEVVNGLILRRLTAADLMIPPDDWNDDLTNLRLRGDRVFFDIGKWPRGRLFTYRLGESQATEITSVEARQVVALRRDGAVIEQVSQQAAYRIVTLDGRASAPVPGAVLAWNDRGDLVVLHTGEDWDIQHTFELIAASTAPIARCPQVGSAPPPTPSLGTPTPAPIASEGDHRVYVVERGNDTLTAIDGATHQRLASVVVSHGPFALAVSPDGHRVFVLAESRVDVLETGSLQRIASLPLGENGTNIFAAADNRRAYVSVAASKAGNGRFITVDPDRGLASSLLLLDRATVFAITSRGTLLATGVSGPQTSSCGSTSSLLEIDPDSGAVLDRAVIGTQPVAAMLGSDDTAYVADSCENSLSRIDGQTFATSSWPIPRSPFGLAVSGDGQRAAITLAYAQRQPETRQELGYVTHLDLVSGNSTDSAVPIGVTRALAFSPSGDVLYATGDAAFLAVLDAAGGELIARVPVSGRANDVAVGSIPKATPTPTAEDTAAIVQADLLTGANSDEAPITVRFSSNGQPVHTLTFDLVTTWGISLVGTGGNTECVVDPAIAAEATFRHAEFCGYYCDRTHIRIAMKDAGTTLPSAAPLITCWARPSAFGHSPLLITAAAGADSLGNPLPVRSGDGAIRVLAQYQVTPPPTRSQTPVPTITPPLPTATPLPPVVLEAGSARIAAGERGQIQVRLRARGAAVAGVQNDIAVDADIAIATRPNGRPACLVNPEIERPDTLTAFLPEGCNAQLGECTAVRIIVVAFEVVPPIADGSVLYTCEVKVAPDTAEGSHELELDNVVVAGSDGARLDATGANGAVVVSRPAPGAPTQAAATPTIAPPVTLAAVTTAPPSDTVVANAAPTSQANLGNESPATSANGTSGCNLQSTASQDWTWLLLALPALLRTRCPRARRASCPSPAEPAQLATARLRRLN
ncbi:MAG TPA: hypothetical protein VEB21_11360 [Terriglobales bacterium]|nr:hypothetical protein [Terriglobales bacterium]